MQVIFIKLTRFTKQLFFWELEALFSFKQLVFAGILLSCLTLSVNAQSNEPPIPFEGESIVYRNNVNLEQIPDSLMQKIATWIKSDRMLSLTEKNADSNRIVASGIFVVSAKRTRETVTCVFECQIAENKVSYNYHSFFIKSIGEGLEKLIEMNKDSERQTVQENLRFIKLGVHSRIASHSKAFKTFIKTMN